MKPQQQGTNVLNISIANTTFIPAAEEAEACKENGNLPTHQQNSSR
jgi:hypothetical protein